MTEDSARGTRLFVDCDMKEPEIQPFASGVAGVYSARRPGREGPNEDGAALIPFGEGHGVLVVADGAGGMPAGALASTVALKELEVAIARAASDGGDLREAIVSGFENANRAILQLGVGAATTMAAAEIEDGTLRPYHVGDSFILLVGQRGRRKWQTVSHSPVGYALEAGILSEREAMVHEARHLVSNMVGTPDMRIEVGPSLAFAPRDTVLLATDGLCDNLQTEEIVELLRKGPLSRVMGRLAGRCRERMTHPNGVDPSKPDDLTFIAFRHR